MFRVSEMDQLAVYIHWPYCVSKCPYCDFNSHVGAGTDHVRWRAVYAKELRYYAALLPARRVTSVFFGGGTPSLMEAGTVSAVLGEIARYWQLAENVEITLEANPNSAEAGKFEEFRKAGVNRLSLGVQSLRDEALKFLGRAHDASEARRAIVLARENFPRFSFDLIYARADQTLASWENELCEALTLADGHISLYQLTIEPGTQFHTRHQRGEKLTAPEEDTARMYELTQDILESAGLPAYEISNHARKGQESRHNLAYWRYEDYIGIGPGAHGRYAAGGTRFATENHRAPEVWLDHVEREGAGSRLRDEIDEATAKLEALLMGLRLDEGINRAAWAQKFSETLDAFLPPAHIARLLEEGYIASDTARLKATPSGRQRLNAVLAYLTA
jgi:oxygen-independent coproporphyrinogen-3 oxidase